MAGRRPLPTAVKQLRGNPGKRPLNEHEAKPRAVIPPAPKHLGEEAKREWRRTAKLLHSLGLLTEVDRTALAAYCTAYGRWVEAEEQLRTYGLILRSPDKGWPIQSPYLAIANKAMEQMQRLLIEFGMTPASRSKVHAVLPEELDEEDSFMEFLLSRPRVPNPYDQDTA